MVPESARERTFSCTPARTLLDRERMEGSLSLSLSVVASVSASTTTTTTTTITTTVMTPGHRVETGCSETRRKKKRRAHAMTRDQHEDDPCDPHSDLHRSYSLRALSLSLPLSLSPRTLRPLASSRWLFSRVRRFCSTALNAEGERYRWRFHRARYYVRRSDFLMEFILS